MQSTLAQQLEPAAVSFETLHKNYSPMLSLVNELIGVIPNCDPILEIWPTGFRTYNLLVPNFLNLPFSLLKGKSHKSLMGLAMYTSSMAAGCSYCAAHCCSFALRRGIDSKAILGDRTLIEKAVVTMAEGMSRIPADFTPEQYHMITSYLSKEAIEQIAFSVCLMGFLNKCMDALGVELESESLGDVGELLTAAGWKPGKHVRHSINLSAIATTPIKTDGFGTYLRVIRHAPRAIKIEKQWTTGVPDSYPEAKKYLEEQVGHSFSILEKIKSKRILKTLTSVLKDNLDPNTTKLGLEIKYLTSLVYYSVIKNEVLAEETKSIISRVSNRLEEETIEKIKVIALMRVPKDKISCKNILSELATLPDLSIKDAATILLARAVSGSPAEVNKAILKEVVPILDPISVVELITWVSIQQLLHRLDVFYQIAED